MGATVRPNLFVVGAPKCGTTALHYYLGQHPQIFMPARKEMYHLAPDLEFDAFVAIHDEREYLAEFDRGAGFDYPRYGGRRVELVYDNERVVALRYPDGSEARLVYNIHGFPTKIVTPFGERVILKRGADQLIRTVTVYNVDDPRQPPLPMELSVKFRTLVIVRRFLPLV